MTFVLFEREARLTSGEMGEDQCQLVEWNIKAFNGQ